MSGRNIIQLLKAVDLLSEPGGTSIKELSSWLEVDRRSVYRLLEVIQELGFPVYDEQDLGREKSWKLDAGYVLKLPNINLPDVRLQLSEIIALYLLRAESSLYSGTEIESRADSAFSKLSQFVPQDFYAQVSKLSRLFVSPRKLSKDYTGKEEIIDTLTNAMLKNTTCVVSYFSFAANGNKKFRIDPLYFFESGGGLYLFVRVTRFQEIRILALERIQDMEMLDQGFEYPEDFHPEELLEQAFDMVYDEPLDLEVWFTADQAKYITERKYSASQEIEDKPDGSIILRMRTSGWFDVKKWLLSFGSSAQVLGPNELREEIREELQAALDLYSQP